MLSPSVRRCNLRFFSGYGKSLHFAEVEGNSSRSQEQLRFPTAESRRFVLVAFNRVNCVVKFVSHEEIIWFRCFIARFHCLSFCCNIVAEPISIRSQGLCVCGAPVCDVLLPQFIDI
jgi:hypothetical protein